jgi:putative phosphoribosyl transferase
MRAAMEWVRHRGAAGIIVAAPVASREACNLIMAEKDHVILCHHIAPEPFWAVGVWYESFPQVSDDEVKRYLDLAEAARPPHSGLHGDARTAHPPSGIR